MTTSISLGSPAMAKRRRRRRRIPWQQTWARRRLKTPSATVKSEGVKEKHTHFFIHRNGPTYRVPTHTTRSEKYAEGDRHNNNLAIMESCLEGVDLTVPQVQHHYSVCLDGTPNAKGVSGATGLFSVTLTLGSHCLRRPKLPTPVNRPKTLKKGHFGWWEIS